MKEKILAQLKLTCGDKTSISLRTLETLAATLSANITEETQIDAAIESYKPFLQELDGNINFVAAKAVKDKAVIPPAAPPPPDNSEPAWFTAFKQEQIQKSADLEAKFAGIQRKEQTDALVAQAKKMFSTKYKISDSEQALFEKAVAIELKFNPNHETAESLVTGLKSQYEDLRSAVGLSGVEPIGANDGSGDKGKSRPQMEALKKSLQGSGKLPTPQQN